MALATACTTAEPAAPLDAPGPSQAEQARLEAEAQAEEERQAAAAEAQRLDDEALQGFRSCRKEGQSMDELARSSGNPGQYLASARILEGCAARLAVSPEAVDEDARMRVAALSVLNWAKGGDAAKARQGLSAFEAEFPGRDLYYPDGTSFTETMAMGLGLSADDAAGAFSAANVNPRLKAEMRRVRYWQAH